MRHPPFVILHRSRQDTSSYAYLGIRKLLIKVPSYTLSYLGMIGVWEFLEGCTHLQAPARLANVILVAKETRATFGKQTELLRTIDSRLLEITRSMAASADAAAFAEGRSTTMA